MWMSAPGSGSASAVGLMSVGTTVGGSASSSAGYPPISTHASMISLADVPGGSPRLSTLTRVPDVAASKGRPGGGLKWSEVCERVQQPDGSVRTSPPFKSGSGQPATVSPPRPRPAGPGLVKFDAPTKASLLVAGGPSSSLGGSSRGGSSGKSSRSSSRDPHARDGDISSRCSSGGGWDTSTASSGMSRPRTPDNSAQSPSGSNDALLMPDPIRTSLALPPALLDGEPPATEGGKASSSTTDSSHLHSGSDRVGIPLKWDPCGRDGSARCGQKKAPEWSAEPLTKYVRGVSAQIEANVQNSCLPTAEKLDAFVHRLVTNMHRQMRHAPRTIRHALQALFSRSFQRFWNFGRNEKLRTTTPEELRVCLASIVEGLITEFGASPEPLAQPRPTRSAPRLQRLAN